MKQYKYEGDAFSKLNQLFMEGAMAADGAAKIELATVTKSPPELEITLDSDGLMLDKDNLIVAEHLTRHDRIVTIEHEELAERELGDKIELDHLDTDELLVPITTYKHSYVKMTFEDVLKKGDRILVACLDADMTYVILDRARWY